LLQTSLFLLKPLLKHTQWPSVCQQASSIFTVSSTSRESQFVGEIRIILLVVLLPEIRIFRRLANPDNGIDFSRHPSWDVHRAASANVPRQEPST
jgi:hypothetical protein